MQQTGTILTIMLKGHPIIIPIKLYKISQAVKQEVIWFNIFRRPPKDHSGKVWFKSN